jgi:hypothetical protein
VKKLNQISRTKELKKMRANSKLGQFKNRCFEWFRLGIGKSSRSVIIQSSDQIKKWGQKSRLNEHDDNVENGGFDIESGI